MLSVMGCTHTHIFSIVSGPNNVSWVKSNRSLWYPLTLFRTPFRHRRLRECSVKVRALDLTNPSGIKGMGGWKESWGKLRATYSARWDEGLQQNMAAKDREWPMTRSIAAASDRYSVKNGNFVRNWGSGTAPCALGQSLRQLALNGTYVLCSTM
jgi:hypothetical protein